MSKRRSDSLWYPRYVGDYQRKTAHLSLAEHGAYAMLLDHYYSTGKPLPANASRLQTICRAFAPSDVDAMHAVLREFFIEEDGVHRNLRADEELLKRCDISEKRSNAARTRHAIAGTNAHANAPAIGHTATATIELTKVSSLRPRQFPKKLAETADFISFWNLYPRTRRGSKQKAFAIWMKAVQTVQPTAILAGLDRYVSSRDVANGYGKNADVWLRNECWNDDPWPAVKSGHASPARPARPQMQDALAELKLTFDDDE